MQVSVETTAGLERRMTVALPSDDIDSEVHQRLQKLSKTARINGFRPGKVPFTVVKKRYEPQVRSEVLGSLINQSFYDAVQQEQLRPAGQPEISPVESEEKEGEDDAGFRFVATFEVYPDFEPVYNGEIMVKRPQVEIGEADIDEMLESLRKQRASFELVDRASADGDQVVIDFDGRLDGVAFDGGKAEMAPLVLGSGQMIPGFEEQLVGVNAGDEKTIEVTFPEDYQADHLAGQTASFVINVHEVRESAMPEFDEEMVKSFGIEDGTVASLREDVHKNMMRELKQRVDSSIKTQVMDGLVELNPIDVPSALLKEEIGRQREQLMQQMPAESDSSFLTDELFTDQALHRVRLGLVVREIVQRAEIKADAPAVRQQVESLASSYQDPQQVVDYYYGNPELLKNVEGLVLEELVTAAILDKATVTDDPKTFQEVMNPKAPEAAASDDSAESSDDQQ